MVAPPPSNQPNPRPPRLASAERLALGLAAAGLVCFVAALDWIEIDRAPTVAAGQANLRRLWPFWISGAALWAALTWIWMLLREGRFFSSGRFSSHAAVILIVAIAARASILQFHQPSISDDVYRIIFDGRNTAGGFNPYLQRPIDRLADANVDVAERPIVAVEKSAEVQLEGGERWPDEARIVPLINNPDLYAIYLPTAQWVYAGVAVAVGHANPSPVVLARIYRAVFILLEVGVIVLILMALRRNGRSAWWAALYAWHPLALAEIAGSGHHDVIGIVFMLLALAWHRGERPLLSPSLEGGGQGVGENSDRSENVRTSHPPAPSLRGRGSSAPAPTNVWQWTIPLALAALVKPVVLPLAPLLLRRRPLRDWIISIVVGAAVCFVVAAPLLLTHDAQPLSNLRATLDRFTWKWAHFGSVYEPVRWAVAKAWTPETSGDPVDPGVQGWIRERQERAARLICVALFAAVVAIVWLKARDAWSGGRTIFFAMVLLSSTAHPWYLLWALALFPMSPRAALWIATLTISWGYAVLGDTINWSSSPMLRWVMLAAYLPVYAALVIDLVMRVTRGSNAQAKARS